MGGWVRAGWCLEGWDGLRFGGFGGLGLGMVRFGRVGWPHTLLLSPSQRKLSHPIPSCPIPPHPIPYHHTVFDPIRRHLPATLHHMPHDLSPPTPFPSSSATPSRPSPPFLPQRTCVARHSHRMLHRCALPCLDIPLQQMRSSLNQHTTIHNTV